MLHARLSTAISIRDGGWRLSCYARWCGYSTLEVCIKALRPFADNLAKYIKLPWWCAKHLKEQLTVKWEDSTPTVNVYQCLDTL